MKNLQKKIDKHKKNHDYKAALYADSLRVQKYVRDKYSKSISAYQDCMDSNKDPGYWCCVGLCMAKCGFGYVKDKVSGDMARTIIAKAAKASLKKHLDKMIPVYNVLSTGVDVGNALIGCSAGCGITHSYQPPDSPLSIWTWL